MTPIPDELEGNLIQNFLKHITDGDSGSTLLGTTAAGLLTSHTDFSHVSHGLKESGDTEMWAKVAAVVVLAVWGYYTGKSRKQPIDSKGGDPIQ